MMKSSSSRMLLMQLVTVLCMVLFTLPKYCLANLYDGDDHHVTLFTDHDTFQQTVISGDGIWMVLFFSPTSSECQRMVKDYKQVATIARGIYNVAAVDMSTDVGQRIGDEFANIESSTSVPMTYVFGDESKPKRYRGNPTAQDMLQELVGYAMNTLKVRAGDPTAKREGDGGGDDGAASKVVQLTSSNFQQEVLDNPKVSAVAFTAPWCGHCKRLQPEWEQAARKLAGEEAFLGWVDATEENQLASIYGVQGYPTIKLFPGGSNKSHSDAKDYQGGRTAADIVQSVLAEVDRTGVPKDIPELTSEKVLKEECSGQNHICVLAALPHILDSSADGRNAYKELLSKVAKTFRGSAFSFLWFEGSSQPELEQVFELTFGFPAVVAFSMDREAYVVMRGSFTEKAVAGFLHGVTTGRQRTVKAPKMPKVLTIEPWDGMDGAPIEEEIPLSEIMGWDDDDDEEKKEGEL